MKLKNKGISLFVLYLMGGILLTSIESVDAGQTRAVENSSLKVYKIKNTRVSRIEQTTTKSSSTFSDPALSKSKYFQWSRRLYDKHYLPSGWRR